jgi:hypothetical protein
LAALAPSNNATARDTPIVILRNCISNSPFWSGQDERLH